MSARLGVIANRLRQLARSIPSDARAIRALVEGPLDARSYYPERARKSKPTILGELIWWWIRFQEVNGYYYLYGLDGVDAETDSLMPYRHFRAIRNSRNLHPANLSAYYGTSYNFVCVTRDKFLFSQIASSLGFPVPRLWALCSTDSVLWVDSAVRVPLEEFLSGPDFRVDGVCKPVDGIMGSGVFLLAIEGSRMFIDGAEASIDDLRSRLSRPHLLQARVTQHPALARLHPHSINTLRLVTFNQSGTVVPFSAALRIGTGGHSTDNWSAGGILAAVDLDSGIVKGDGYMKPAHGRRFSRHPDTGVTFDGLAVPEFDRAVALVRKFHACLPGIHSIGWDIAIAPEGPVIIEGNDDWDGAIPMLFDPEFKRKFAALY